MVELFANSGDPDQTLRSASSELGPHCLPITILGVSKLQWVKSDVKKRVDYAINLQSKRVDTH